MQYCHTCGVETEFAECADTPGQFACTQCGEVDTTIHLERDTDPTGTQSNDGRMALRYRGHSQGKDLARREKDVLEILRDIWASVLGDTTRNLDDAKYLVYQMTPKARYGGENIVALCGACAYEIMKRDSKSVNIRQVAVAVHTSRAQEGTHQEALKKVSRQHKKLKQMTADWAGDNPELVGTNTLEGFTEKVHWEHTQLVVKSGLGRELNLRCGVLGVLRTY